MITARRRPNADQNPRELVPALLGVMLMVTMFSYITQHWSPFVEPHAARNHVVRSGALAVARDGLHGQALGAAGGLAWPPELWAGAILLCGATGLLPSFLVVPMTTTPD